MTQVKHGAATLACQSYRLKPTLSTLLQLPRRAARHSVCAWGRRGRAHGAAVVGGLEFVGLCPKLGADTLEQREEVSIFYQRLK